jgi:predicted helicase
MTTTIHTILDEFRQAAQSNRDLGDKFEKLIANYLVTDPLYKDKYSDVWLWQEWPARGNRPDTGIDLVAKDRYTNEFCAIQCKFYDPTYTLQKGDIDSFFTTSGKAPFTSRMIVSTTDKWSNHAEDALNNQHVPVTRLRVQDLADSPVDWSKFSLNRPQDIKLKEKKKLREHQKVAFKNVVEGLKESDRGKLIMACGTGKTFTALRLAEKLAADTKLVLFLVPSISLLSQALREWTADAESTLHCFAVCSDTKVGRRSENEDISTHDLAFPATTDAKKLVQRVEAFSGKRQLTVVFSTYQSIQVVSDAQKKGLPDFDLVICDEAHRTTGVTIEGEEDSHFVRVHGDKFLKATKRLYMTATPRIYADSTKSQAQEANAVLCSMDDEKLYGKELHRLGFSDAVGAGLLSDYKVMVLAVDEKFVTKTFQRQIADKNNELTLDDAVKITGCWNGLSKRFAKDVEGKAVEADLAPMHRAVAFSRSIKDSKRITQLFSQIIEQYTAARTDDEELLRCEAEHVDGTFNALARNQKLDWLKADTALRGNVCRILSNARCLSEGVDVPALDAVLFLNPRNSVVDVVQSVGRVMRKAEGKKYGYVILPVGIPADMTPEEALKDNEKYKVVWQVLQALRAHDDRFNATVNQIELNKARPDQIQVIGVSGGPEEGQDGSQGKAQGVQFTFAFPDLEEWREAIYARIVLKCGDRRYWESWAKDVAQIAERHTTRIKALLDGFGQKHRKVFDEFLKGLQTNLNPSIDEEAAIEMLSQHLITKPVFDALFEGYKFTQRNPVSIAMQKMLDLLEGESLEKETASLEKFYASVRDKASGIDNAEGKQRIIVELYDKFFRTAFPRMAERLGIVYTPVELVDFILKSTDFVLRQEFNAGLSSKGVHVLDPFTGTGTFIARLLHSGLVKPEDLRHKYEHELHANEIVLLAYYIAAINIEEAFHGAVGGDYSPFEGIVLTDTFQMSEAQGTLNEGMFPENNLRVRRQNQRDIRVIVGNPPYSALQQSSNDNNANLKYPRLDDRIRATYAAESTATLKSSLYDSYKRAMRWASDRVKSEGVIAFVTNASFIDGTADDGIRKSLAKEFAAIYCFNLRGNARTQGETRRKEKGNVFGAGTRTPVAITLLVRKPGHKGPAHIHYHDIGDYLSGAEKLEIVRQFDSIANIPWKAIAPNDVGDWVNQRNPDFDRFAPIGDREGSQQALFKVYSPGVMSNRDAWTYNSSPNNLRANIGRLVSNYNEEVRRYKKACQGKNQDDRPSVQDVVDLSPDRIAWSSGLLADAVRGRNANFEEGKMIKAAYRPFCRQWFYADSMMNDRLGHAAKLFPTTLPNVVMAISGVGASKGFSALVSDSPVNRHFLDTCQYFPLYIYDTDDSGDSNSGDLFNDTTKSVARKSPISDWALQQCQQAANDMMIAKDDIFYYVYGLLHSKNYRDRFDANLRKSLPRIPFLPDFRAFAIAGKKLAELHLDYEQVKPWPLKEESSALPMEPEHYYRVQKMAFGKTNGKEDRTIIVYNSTLSLSGIPKDAYDYIVNGKSAIEWIMERYQVTKDKDSGIVNDPNDWSDDPKYIVNLLKRIVTVSIETMKIVNALPPLNERVPGPKVH